VRPVFAKLREIGYPVVSQCESRIFVKLGLFLGLALALFAPGAARADWYEASTTHFRVFAEGKPETVRDFATRLERYDKGMRFLRRMPDEDLGPANRVTVYVVSSVSALQRIARMGDNVAGFYIPRAEGSVAFTPRRAGGGAVWDIDAQIILLHEYAHHFMLSNFAASAFPPWFIEGYAEFHSTARFDEDGAIGFGLPATHRAYELASTHSKLSDTLFGPGSGRRRPTAQDNAIVYGWGWLLTHYLTFEQSRQGQLAVYLRAINQGKSGLEAARSAFGDLDRLEKDLRAYFERSRMTYVRLAPEALKIGPVTVRQLRAGEVAVLPLHMRSDRGVTPQQAKSLVVEMRRAAAPYPNDPAVQTALAEAEYDSDNLDLAEAAADRAIAADPKNSEALTYRGRVAMARAIAAGAKDAATWTEVRRRFLAANKADGDDPSPFIQFYDSFRAQGIAPTANAVTGLQRAFELAPHDGGLRMQVAHQYLVDGKGAEARAVLAPIAFNPHGGAMSEAIQAIIATIDESGASAALAFWDKSKKPGIGESSAPPPGGD
jgi:tetratricopeptide (TPR) repeat protein